MRQTLRAALVANTPTMLWGLPGIGKTQTIDQLVKSVGGHLYTLVLATSDPSDIGGIPWVSNDVVKYAPHEWAQECNEAAEAGKLVVVFLDEMNTAPVLNIAAALTLIQDRKMGGFQLHPDIRFVMASNPPEASAGGRELPAPAANRMLHLPWEADAAEYVQALLHGWQPMVMPEVRPDNVQKNLGDIQMVVAGFLSAKPHMLMNMPDKETQAGKAWPSPRSWDMAIRTAAFARSAGMGYEVEGECFLAAIGTGAGSEYLTFARDLDLPDPKDILADPMHANMPDRTDQLFTVLATLSKYVVDNMNDKTWEPYWKYMFRAADEVGVDVATIHAEYTTKMAVEKRKLEKLPRPDAKLLKPFIDIYKAAG
jgi:hypothetical protein